MNARDPGEHPPGWSPRQVLVGGAAVIAATVLLVTGWPSGWKELEVTATAYNSLPSQTTAVDPDIAAWGDRLEPGMKALAVSRDLLDLGLTRGTVVRIEGLPGRWRVLDKMNRRWTRRIDIYMGLDVAAAREWGRREVTIRWRPAAEESQ